MSMEVSRRRMLQLAVAPTLLARAQPQFQDLASVARTPTRCSGITMTRRASLALAAVTVSFVAAPLTSAEVTPRTQPGTTRTVYISAVDVKGQEQTSEAPC